MSSRAPVSGEQDLREAFSKADGDVKFGFINIGINFDTNKFFVKKYALNEDDDIKNVFNEMVKLCTEKEHTYFIIRDTSKENTKNATSNDNNDDDNDNNNEKNNKLSNRYILIHYAPDLSPVKQRMMYASSRPSLKSFLGQANFSEDYHCSTLKELNFETIVESRTLHHKIDFRSDQEIEKEQASIESVAKSATSQVMKSLPIDIKENAQKAIENYKSETCKCVFLTLDGKTTGIEGEEQKVDKIADIRGLLNDTDPKYILFWYANSNPNQTTDDNKDDTTKGDKRIFGYYCPDKADRKLRFTYSTCKTNVIDYCTKNEIKFYQKVEFSALNDFDNKFLDYHVFPVKEKKETFAMPKAPKTRRKSKSKKRKKINVDDL